MRFRLGDITQVVGGRIIQGDEMVYGEGVGIDTRTIAPRELYVAIPGAHFDGHDFLEEAKRKEVSAAIVHQGHALPPMLPAIAVEDTVQALGDLAFWWRSRFDVPCVAVTGSNGKSTTKEMIAAVLAQAGEVLKTEGNFNNLIGMPLTVLRWKSEHAVAVIEMGMNAPGEIARLAQIARPTIGVITNVTAAHLEKLHTVEAVARAKAELFQEMGPHAFIVVNGEDPWVMKMAALRRGPRITFGMQNDHDVRFLHMETEGLEAMQLKLAVHGHEVELRLPVPGAHNVMNAMAAIAVGVALGMDVNESAHRLEQFRPMPMRFERIQLMDGVRLVNDSYNANPESMRAAFRAVGAARRAGHFVAALGDMLEMGDQAAALHRQLGHDAVCMGVEQLVTLGTFAEAVAAGAREAGLPAKAVQACSTMEELIAWLMETLRTGDVLLVKGSRGMRMERAVSHLKETIGMG